MKCRAAIDMVGHENAIIPLKERVVDEYYDPLRKVLRLVKNV